ncbi:hypothetical protein MXAN_4131 [Myxococcus xanthus DK 1622]|uniref:Uncharacterized protein n=1 Tax=Myxococcus xanthus (strain DK1622) TaxID=246197 RepID=Q1D4W7_MYXXD|nr:MULTISPECIES: hypothetical protein [Myxococcus]ABF92547.1 hypothetical protein MXAN_4131 [Myxococcus xanthus DK 1622]NOJ51449.1 hypothetical protein [Myxococcus xanthus]QPM76738.1 hypothetical protein I5Q59_20445 [Myxococcus xanthus]QVW65805.1 hypothetical protein JTM82_25800 [Myxococcus xanthus DZ2]QZZ51818.1 hypothetical protein MyxoNM_21670 [Myxococcus xanthus]
MAVFRQIVQCEFCAATTLIRIQIGYLEQHPIRVPCGSCGVLISATAFVSQSKPKFWVDYRNAKLVDDESGDFYIEASPEFLTEKLQKLDRRAPPLDFSPFIKAFAVMGDKGYEEFGRNIQRFSHILKTSWPQIQRINQLWLSRALPQLAREILTMQARLEFLAPNQLSISNELQSLMAVHRLNLLFISPIRNPERFEEITKLIFKALKKFSAAQIADLMDFGEMLNQRGYLQQLEEKFLCLTELFVERFRFLIPVFGLRYYQSRDPDLLERKGVTTTSFEDLKQLFLFSHEIISESLTLIVGWNNVRNRGGWSRMAPRREDVQTLSQYEDKSLDARAQYLDGSEVFDRLLHNYWDEPLCSSIAHGFHKYEGVEQRVIYYAGGLKDEANKRSVFLVEFTHRCLELFLAAQDVAELLYQTQKLVFGRQGQQSIPPPIRRR